jgi:hypothetical protein
LPSMKGRLTGGSLILVRSHSSRFMLSLANSLAVGHAVYTLYFPSLNSDPDF